MESCTSLAERTRRQIQSFRLTPKTPSFFAKESLRLAALAAVSMAVLMALGPFFFRRFDQPEFMSSVCFGPLEGGNEFGMGRGWIHEDFFI